jgi:hypothetical protein
MPKLTSAANADEDRMNIKRSLQNLLARSKAFDPASQLFLSVDRSTIEKDLDLRGRAEKEGKSNIPSANASAKDAIAADIDVYFMEVLRRGKDELQDHLRAMGALDNVQSIDQQITELRTTTLEALNNLYANCKDGVNELYPKKREVADGELAYEKFRSNNNLNRPGHFPENRFREFWWIIFALVIEALFNSWALGTAHPEGPLGVFLETVFIATTNVFLGAAIGGFCWRQTFHKKKFRAFFGYFLSLMLTILVLTFNFVIGHYRDSLIGLQTREFNANVESFYAAYANLFRTTVQSAFSENYWAFGGLMSVLLIIVGIAMAVFAAVKAFTLDDQYPGYGKLSRAQDDRYADYADVFSKLQTELQEISGMTGTTIAGIFEMGRASRGVISEHEDTFRALHSKYQSWVAELEALGTALYASYRQVNSTYRTEGLPPSFDISFSISNDIADSPILPKPAEEQDIQNLRILKDSCLSVVNAASNRYLGIYKTIGELAPKNIAAERANTFDAEVEKVNIELQEIAHQSGISYNRNFDNE